MANIYKTKIKIPTKNKQKVKIGITDCSIINKTF